MLLVSGILGPGAQQPIPKRLMRQERVDGPFRLFLNVSKSNKWDVEAQLEDRALKSVSYSLGDGNDIYPEHGRLPTLKRQVFRSQIAQGTHV